MRELTTRRLLLRPWTSDDTEDLLRLLRAPGVRRFLLDDQVVDSAWVEGEIAASEERFVSSGTGLWIAVARDREEVVGFAGFRPFFDPPKLQLLYGVDPSRWGSGLATELACEIIRCAFEDLALPEVIGATDLPNVASVRVMEKAGMTRFRETTEGVAGTVYFRIGREDWQQRRSPEAGAPDAAFSPRKPTVLFVCTHNSARSQIAEALVRSRFGDRLEVASAGTEPSRVHELAIAVMAEIGVDLAGHRAQGIEELTPPRGGFDFVVTVCDGARESCPFVPARVRNFHRAFDDPSRAAGDDAARLAAFRQARDEIGEWLDEVVPDWLSEAGAVDAFGGL